MSNSSKETPVPREIQVKLLLAGGHEHILYLPEDSPTLKQLFAALVNQTQVSPAQASSSNSGLFQIPVNQQRGLLAFPSQHLVGIVTEPPLSVQIQAPQNQSAPVQSASVQTGQILKTSDGESIAAPYVQIPNFLDPQAYQELLNYALTNEAEFVETGPVTNTEYYKDYRNSRVIFYPKKIDRILQQIKDAMPQVISHLSMPSFSVTDIEVQLTAHNDNNYYKIHNDNGSPETATRKLTYVYYFYQEPKAFQGGELSIYGTTNAFEITAATPKQLIQPINNSIVFFPSQFMHEVLPIQCPSQRFVDSRFTVNGWVRAV